MIRDADVAWMRKTQIEALPDWVIVERATSSSDGMGGGSVTWAAIGTVSGRLAPRQLNAGEPVIGGQPASQSYWYITLPIGTDVTERDRLISGGRSFEVTRVNTTESWQTAVRCECVAYNQERRA